MDGLSTAASVIAVIDLSAKVASVCVQYYSAVKSAKKDIAHLQDVIKNLNDVLNMLRALLDDKHSLRLESSRKLNPALNQCFLDLQALENKLNPGKRKSTMSRMGIRALKWPYTSKEVDRIIKNLQLTKESITLAMQIDQAKLAVRHDLHIDFSRLPKAEGAAFDSHMDEHDARCHPDTRIELLARIRLWANDPCGKCIFWLNGMAGTGKSTIARTIANMWSDADELGASFFFRRGEGDRGHAARFFTTIASQLVRTIPGMIPDISKAIDDTPDIAEKWMKEQFDKLVLEPLLAMRHDRNKTPTRVVVIDALDECERDEDIRTLLDLLSRAQEIQSVRLRIFITSRPDLPVRLGFKRMSEEKHQDLVLHEIPKQLVEKDLSAFLEHELARIRNDHCLPRGWPGDTSMRALVTMASPLFIFAATACRFLDDQRLGGSPETRLQDILHDQSIEGASQLGKTYLPVLKRLEADIADLPKQKLEERFRLIVGTIVLLEEPLSALSLSGLLAVNKNDINGLLSMLHSVLHIPTDQKVPVRLLHLSFRDFLIDPATRPRTMFAVSCAETHEMMAIKCLNLMMDSKKGLRENFCDLDSVGTLRNDISDEKVLSCLSPELRYACRHWVCHLQQSGNALKYQSDVEHFLKTHLLHWFEAMGLLQRMREAVAMITSLQSTRTSDESSYTKLLRDVVRFGLRNRSIIEYAPLQTYVSALVFAPNQSVARNQYSLPKWLQTRVMVDDTWSATLQTLEGHTHSVYAVAFSSDGEVVASGSYDQSIKLWDAQSGRDGATFVGDKVSVHSLGLSQNVAEASSFNDKFFKPLATLKGHTDGVRAVAFTPNGVIASSSNDKSVKLWDTSSGKEIATLLGHTDRVRAVAFSPNGVVASCSEDKSIKLWDTLCGKEIATLTGHTGSVNAIAFSTIGVVASGSNDKSVKLWDAQSGTELATLTGHTDSVNAIAFSLDGIIASGSNDKSVKLWDASSRKELVTLTGHTDWVRTVAFSSDCSIVASGSDDKSIKLWDAQSGKDLVTLTGHTDWVRALAFSPDGSVVASGSDDGSIKLWDTQFRQDRATSMAHMDWVRAMAFSPNGLILASGSDDRSVKLWDTQSGQELATLVGHTGWVRAVTFSRDGLVLASGSDDRTIKLWDARSRKALVTFMGHTGYINAVAFSPDSSVVASGSDDRSVKLWDARSGQELKTLETDGAVTELFFSSDASTLHTNRGILQTGINTIQATTPVSIVHTPFLVQDEWIFRGSERLLWLPFEYRATTFAVHGSTIALGHTSGRVSILAIS